MPGSRAARITLMGTGRARRWSAGILGALALSSLPLSAQTDYVGDVRFAIEELGKQCGELLRTKKIDWKAATDPILEQAKDVKTPSEHWLVLQRLIARLHDGHAEVQPLPAAGGVQWPPDPKGEKTGPGMFWCQVGEKIYIKNVWNDAERVGLAPGMEVISIDGQPVLEWLEHRIEALSDLESFSTRQQAFFI